MTISADRRAMERYLPQRGAMVLLDALLRDEADTVVCRCTIDEHFVFAEAGAVEALAAIEIAAQTAAVYVSIHSKTPTIGFLASCREAEFAVPAYAIGDVLEVTATRLSGNDRSGAFACVVRRAGVTCATMHLILVDPGWSENNAS